MNISVSGCIFRLPLNGLNKIPYLLNMINDCDGNNNEIKLERSPDVFRHVLAYVIDPLYPFPIKYSYELDFLGIEYNKDSLYNTNKEILCKLELLQYQNDQFKNEINDIKNKIDQIDKDNINRNEVILIETRL